MSYCNPAGGVVVTGVSSCCAGRLANDGLHDCIWLNFRFNPVEFTNTPNLVDGVTGYKFAIHDPCEKLFFKSMT